MQKSLGQNERAITLGMGQLAVAARNTKTAEDNLAEMKSGGTDTHTIAEASKTQAAAAKDSVKAAQDSIAVLRKGQRPYVSVLDYTSFEPIADKWSIPPADFKEPTAGHTVAVQAHCKNTGRSPAVNLAVHIHLLHGSDATEIRMVSQDASIGPQMDVGTEGNTVAFSRQTPTWSRSNSNRNISSSGMDSGQSSCTGEFLMRTFGGISIAAHLPLNTLTEPGHISRN